MKLVFEKLYDITFPESDDKSALYFQGQYNRIDDKIIIKKNNSIDLGTYFNLFSIKKWIDYTNIAKLKIILDVMGEYSVEFYGMTANDEKVICTMQCKDSIEKIFSVDEFADFDCIGIKITALNERLKFHGGQYLGEFPAFCEIRLGITICTFRREKYLLPNLEKLQKLIDKNSNINIMVVDNGRTLDEMETESLQIIHNPNFGGSGGFTRGLIEQVNQNKNTHILLMDDDIIIELSAIERLYSVLCHLKAEYKNNFFGGAMLKLDNPTIQHENTAHWNKILTQAFGGHFDLTNKQILCKNEHVPYNKNQYAAWWFCCIPLEVVKKLGYPLPIFIRGDDIEYGIRNQRQILSMNGIGVWHETFAKKFNASVAYFNDRNMFLINHFADGCGRLTFFTALICRIAKRILTLKFKNIRMLELALKDLNEGLTGITSIASDKKFESLKNYPLDKNIILSILSIIESGIKHCFKYNELDKEYKNFRSEKLSDQKFWRNYLGI